MCCFCFFKEIRHYYFKGRKALDCELQIIGFIRNGDVVILCEYSWACLFGLCVQVELVYVHMYKIATVWSFGW